MNGIPDVFPDPVDPDINKEDQLPDDSEFFEPDETFEEPAPGE